LNPCTQEAEAGRLWVQGQSGVHCETKKKEGRKKGRKEGREGGNKGREGRKGEEELGLNG
jgi:hypothetical protein